MMKNILSLILMLSLGVFGNAQFYTPQIPVVLENGNFDPVEGIDVTFEFLPSGEFMGFTWEEVTDASGRAIGIADVPESVDQGVVLVRFTDCFGEASVTEIPYAKGIPNFDAYISYCSDCRLSSSATDNGDGTVDLVADLQTSNAPVNYEWYVQPTNENFNQANVNYTVPETGEYVFCVTAIDAVGCLQNECYTLYVEVPEDCSVEVYDIDRGQGQYVFEAEGSGVAPFTYTWEINPGGFVYSGDRIEFDAPDFGTYEICIEMVDADGCSSQKCIEITYEEPQECSVEMYIDDLGEGSYLFEAEGSGVAPFTYTWTVQPTSENFSGKTVEYEAADFGTYTVCVLVEDANGCKSDTCREFTYEDTGNDTCSATLEIIDRGNGEFVFEASGDGVAPLEYKWFIDGDLQMWTGNRVEYNASEGTYTVCVGIIDAEGCVSEDCKTFTVEPQSTNPGIEGYIYVEDDLKSNSAWVILYKVRPNQGYEVADVYSSNDGYYIFDSVAENTQYIIHAGLKDDDPFYGAFGPAYHESALKWKDAIQVSVSGTELKRADILLIAEPGTANGQGNAGGNVADGSGKVKGTGLEGALVYLMNSTNTNILTHTTTDELGDYRFSNIAFGTYWIHVEIAGKKPADIMVVLGEGIPNVLNANFTATSGEISGFERTTVVDNSEIYPIPVEQILNWTNVSLESVQVYSVNGRTINIPVNLSYNSAKIDFSELPSGIYLLQGRTENGILQKRVIKK